jgi:phytanoyl-CoA hydroxylase
MTQTTNPADLLAKYDRDGYLIFRDVLDADLVARASEHVGWLMREHPDVRPEDLGNTHLPTDRFWLDLVSDPRLLDIAELFIGPDIALFASHYISKQPFEGKPVLWHQDGAFWPLEPMEVVTLWLAVDESTTENGCLRVIPGSHKEQLHATREATSVENVLGHETVGEVDESQAVDLELRPGDVEVHHPNIMHGSEPNHSPKRRCGLTIRYIPTSTRVTRQTGPYQSWFHLRGERGVNDFQPWPE